MVRARILIVDDHEIFRRGLRSLLETRPEFEILGEAADGLQAVEKAKELQPDIIIMDVSMPQLDGLQATRLIRKKLPNTKILILSQHDTSHMLAAASEAGANGYVTKSQVSRCLLSALDAVAHGRSFNWNGQGTEASATQPTGSSAD
jgi:DNA-binding NarL/FixJ family response regulator